MSQVYVTEPAMAGRVVLETTHGPLDIQLWSRECPLTTKFFMQLCMDGFYDNMVFHRIMPNFLVQTGATRAGQGPDGGDVSKYRKKVEADVALERRQYELNSRIRFSHRGLVAMAMGVDETDDAVTLQPQFFITLEETAHLDGKHVIFGTISGQTIFNAIRIGNTDVDEATGQPSILEEAPRITGVKIQDNPIHTSLVPTHPESIMPWKQDAKSKKKSKKKRKGVKNVKLLSFGDEMMDDEDVDVTERGIKSSHDVIESKLLSRDVDANVEGKLSKSDKPKKSSKKSSKKSKSADAESSDTEEAAKTKTKASKSKTRDAEDGSNGDSNRDGDDDGDSSDVQVEKESARVAYRSSKSKKADKREEELVAKSVSKKMTNEAEAPKKPKVSLVEARRAKYAKKGSKDKRRREDDTLSKFMSFQSKVRKTVAGSKGTGKESKADNSLASRMAKKATSGSKRKGSGDDVEAYHGQVTEGDDGNDNGNGSSKDWMSTTFKCRRHMDQDARLGEDGRDAMDEYEVVEGYKNSSSGDDGHRRKHASSNRHRSDNGDRRHSHRDGGSGKHRHNKHSRGEKRRSK